MVSLEVIKNGCIVSVVDIAVRSTTIFGRAADTVDVHLAHESVSRRHAALELTERNELFLEDLGSTHGTRVNKKSIAQGEKTQLNVGDVIKFGESTRLFAVVGNPDDMPEEYDSQRLQKMRAKLAKSRGNDSQKAKKNTVDGDNEGGGVSWGFAPDATDDGDVDGDGGGDDNNDNENGVLKKQQRDSTQRLAVSREAVHKKDLKLFDRLTKLNAKLVNMQTERGRIFAKENSQGGLSQGQQDQVSRLDQQIQKLQEQVEELEDTIQQR